MMVPLELLLNLMHSVCLCQLPLLLPQLILLNLNSEPAVLPDQHGIQSKIAVSQQPVEKGSFIVQLRKNVSQGVQRVIQRYVTTMVSVSEKNHVSVETVSMDQLKLIQLRKQTTKISVVS